MTEQKQKVLMIEDDHFLRKIYRDKLTRAGFEFIEATNGLEGINKIISEKPDLVLLDLILPRKNGFDVLIDMQRNKETRDIPVIILSNLGQESDVQKGLSLGAKDFLVKSEVSLSQAVEVVKEWAARKKSQSR